MIRFPTSLEQAVASPGEYRAGGTDVQDRRTSGMSHGDLVDLRDLPELRTMGWLPPPEPEPDGAEEVAQESGPPDSGGYSIGARVTLAEMGRSSDLRTWYPGLAGVAGAGANAQIRAVGTIAGNLLQRSRCWYFRHPEFECFKKGGHLCYSRIGDSSRHAIFDLSPSLSVHPSTLGMVLLTYDADVEIQGAPHRSIAELFGDGADPTRENALPSTALVTAVLLPPPLPEERWGYKRAIARRRAEWPLAEAHVRLAMKDATITWARVAVGAVAATPLRLAAVEEALVGARATQANLETAAALATEGATPQPKNAYKLPLLRGAVLEALERAVGGGE